MVNCSLAALAIASAIGFYVLVDGAVQERRIEAPIVDVWHCDGWTGKMYPTEKSMRRAFK